MKKILVMFAFAILILGMNLISAEDNATKIIIPANQTDQITAPANQTTTTPIATPISNNQTTVPGDQTDQTKTPTDKTTIPAITPVPTNSPTTSPSTAIGVRVIVKEQVKCVFKNAATPQKCYAAGDAGYNNEFSCTEGDTCLADVSGNNGEKLTWKSTCGGYAYTIIDGQNEYVEFNCVPEGNTTTERINGKGFRYAYWECYNGEEKRQEDQTSCKPSELWQSYAKGFCKDKCYSDGSKCGVNSFSVTNECYWDAEEKYITPPVNEGEKNNASGDATGGTLICKDSCPLEGKCYPFGYRKSDKFCSDIGSFVEQAKTEVACDNNFECSSNVCVSGKCISEGLIQKVLDWLKNLFG